MEGALTEPSLALQKAIVARLKGDAGLTALVPAENIFDRAGLPQISPCIIVGEDETRREPISLDDDSFGVAATLHVWAKEPNMVTVKRAGGLIQLAMRGKFWAIDDHREVYTRLSIARYMRDPGGEWAHGVLTYESLLVEVAA